MSTKIKRGINFSLAIILLGLLSLLIPQNARATVLDLTTAGASGFINLGFFQQIDPQSTGTGVIHSFVRISSSAKSGLEQAYNTKVNSVFDNTSDDTHNHEVSLSQIPIVTLGGVAYRQFLLDINEPKNGNERLLSLDEIQIFLSDTPNQSVTAFSGGILNLANSDLIYRLDAGSDNWIKLDYALNTGSGSGDMFAYIPDSLFSASSKQYVYLYSKFGQNWPNDSGFEEWAHLEGGTPIPEPATISLLGLGLLGLINLRKKSR